MTQTEILKVNILFFDINETHFADLAQEFYGKVIKCSTPSPTKWVFDIEFSSCQIDNFDEKKGAEIISALDNAKGFISVLEQGYLKPNKKIKK